MSFRRNSKAAHTGKAWLERHREELLACGVPQVVFENERHWNYFLDHGYYTPPGFSEPVINIDRMEQEHLKLLCVFLEVNDRYPDCSIIKELQHRLKREQIP